MPDPFLSEIKLFAFNFAPRGWAQCAGQLLPINQNQALFSLLGTNYGGNGQTTFALPDLRGRAPRGWIDSNPGTPGIQEGTEAVTLTAAQLPVHGHTVDTAQLAGTPACRNAIANQRTPVNTLPAFEANGVSAPYSSSPPDATLNAAAATIAVTAAAAGGSQPHGNRQPYLVLNYCIALQGIFPTRP